MSFDDDFVEELAGALRRVGLDAVVVGNAAAILQGAPVLTQDVDLLVASSRENRRKVSRLANQLGELNPVRVGRGSDRTLRIESRVQVDVIFGRVKGRSPDTGEALTFTCERRRATRVTFGDETLHVAPLEDVIASKQASGREKDRAALPALRTALRTLRAGEP